MKTKKTSCRCTTGISHLSPCSDCRDMHARTAGRTTSRRFLEISTGCELLDRTDDGLLVTSGELVRMIGDPSARTAKLVGVSPAGLPWLVYGDASEETFRHQLEHLSAAWDRALCRGEWAVKS